MARSIKRNDDFDSCEDLESKNVLVFVNYCMCYWINSVMIQENSSVLSAAVVEDIKVNIVKLITLMLVVGAFSIISIMGIL